MANRIDRYWYGTTSKILSVEQDIEKYDWLWDREASLNGRNRLALTIADMQAHRAELQIRLALYLAQNTRREDWSN